MSPPSVKKCYIEDCPYTTTQGLPNFELVMKDLDMHLRSVHMVAAGSQSNNQGGSNKADRLPRPTISEGVTETDWAHFLDKWNRYKRSALQGVTQQYVTDQLWACCEPSLEAAVYNNGINSDTDEQLLLNTMKKLAVRTQNTLVNIVRFLDLSQDQDESASSFTARLKFQALPKKP